MSFRRRAVGWPARSMRSGRSRTSSPPGWPAWPCSPGSGWTRLWATAAASSCHCWQSWRLLGTAGSGPVCWPWPSAAAGSPPCSSTSTPGGTAKSGCRHRRTWPCMCSAGWWRPPSGKPNGRPGWPPNRPLPTCTRATASSPAASGRWWRRSPSSTPSSPTPRSGWPSTTATSATSASTTTWPRPTACRRPTTWARPSRRPCRTFPRNWWPRSRRHSTPECRSAT